MHAGGSSLYGGVLFADRRGYRAADPCAQPGVQNSSLYVLREGSEIRQLLWFSDSPSQSIGVTVRAASESIVLNFPLPCGCLLRRINGWKTLRFQWQNRKRCTQNSRGDDKSQQRFHACFPLRDVAGFYFAIQRRWSWNCLLCAINPTRLRESLLHTGIYTPVPRFPGCIGSS